ncbi:nucleoid-associated protein [Azotobacter beijerinckii]|uniref:Nucleoid-associated protein n=1 Tax=Azotobacter beijerinckii TaxID=170623 RepID=A0A1H6TXF7_9GAMM|nr:nucleoid-associated protein [Azotobacter beijerinckii]SEI82914.1 nucleoid-associated protein [Azotobacter beijerinckii]
MNSIAESMDQPAVNEQTVEVESIQVLNACAAKFKKIQNQGLSYYGHVKGVDWDLQKGVCVEFVKHIEKKFAKGGKFHGFLKENSSTEAVDVFNSYIENKNFSIFVDAVMSNLCNEANAPSRSSINEGYVVFSHYKTKGEEEDLGRILIVMLGKRGGFDFTNDTALEPKSAESLNLEDFRQAAMLDLTLFNTIYPINDGDSYLKFIKGKSQSSFFNVALGCDDYMPSKQCVENLKNALNSFISQVGENLTAGTRKTIRERVGHFIESSGGKTVTLKQVQQVIDKYLPENSSLYGNFTQYVNSNSDLFPVSEEFQPSHATAKKFGFVKVKLPSGDFIGDVKISAIKVGDLSSGDLTVDNDYCYMRIKLPHELSKIIKDLIKNDE